MGQQVVHARMDIVRRNCPPEMRDPPLRFIFIILVPPQRIGFDVLGDIVHFAFVADDVFVVISLPDGDTVRAA